MTDALLCSVRDCPNQATLCKPRSAVPWLDRVSMMRRLYSLPPRYRVTTPDGFDERPHYCRDHHDRAIKLLEGVHAQCRKENADHVARQEELVRMSNEALDLKLSQQDTETAAKLAEQFRTVSTSVEVTRKLLAPSVVTDASESGAAQGEAN